MRMCDINIGVSVDLDQIEGVKRLDDGTSQVWTHHRKYVSMFPYETLLSIITPHQSVGSDADTLGKLDAVLDKVGHYAG